MSHKQTSVKMAMVCSNDTGMKRTGPVKETKQVKRAKKATVVAPPIPIPSGQTSVTFYSKSRTKWARNFSNFATPFEQIPLTITTNNVVHVTPVDGKLQPDTKYQMLFPTIEHAYQAFKYVCSMPDDEKLRALLRRFGVLVFPREGKLANKEADLPLLDVRGAKSAGSKRSMKDRGTALNESAWNGDKVAFMVACVDARISVDPDFRAQLIKVHEDNIFLLHFERSGARSFWGGYIPKTSDGSCYVGNNMLGRILMLKANALATTNHTVLGLHEAETSSTYETNELV
jgi:predicted NAD-dependent protein-ADP-ribosyltransferase YbiA (DUF1768 family)